MEKQHVKKISNLLNLIANLFTLYIVDFKQNFCYKNRYEFWITLNNNRLIHIIARYPRLYGRFPSPFHYYHLQMKFAKVMFLHLSVSHSVHRGVSASVHAGIHPREQTPPGADTPQSRHTLWEQTPLGADTPHAQCMLGYTGNKWDVCILLECILSLHLYVSLQLRVQNAVSAQPCVGKLGISLVLLNFFGLQF